MAGLVILAIIFAFVIVVSSAIQQAGKTATLSSIKKKENKTANNPASNSTSQKIKEVFSLIFSCVCGAISIFFLIMSLILLFIPSNSDDSKSYNVFSAVFCLVIALVFGIPSARFLLKYSKKKKMEMETRILELQRQQQISQQQNFALQQQRFQREREIQAQTPRTAISNQQMYFQSGNVQNYQAERQTVPAQPMSQPQPTFQPQSQIQQGQINIPTSELLLMKIDSVSTSGIYFEKVVCELLKQNGFVNVEMTPSTNDYGIDILAEKEGISYAVQCKCYSATVGNKAVQEAATGRMFYNKMIAVVVTNSTFSKSAVETAKAAQVLLWDRTKLQEMIQHTDQSSLMTLINQVE